MRPLLLLAVAAGLAAPAAAADTPATLVALEAKWSKATVANDLPTIDGIMAADWVGQNPGGKPMTKATLLAEYKSGKTKVTAMTNRDVTARIFGDIAVVQGADDEKSSYDKKDTSGAYTWTDVFQKRGGKWVAIASQVTPVDKKK